MGQFLSIGLVTTCGTSKTDSDKQHITKDKLLTAMISNNYFEPSIYDFSETEDSYKFNLNSKIIENQLIPFLEKFYPLLYPNQLYDYEEVINVLKKSDPSTWLKIADKKSYAYFQLDKYGNYDYVYFKEPLNSFSSIFSTSIILSLEGKIIMESYGRHFNFFRYCIQNAFPQFPIAKAIRVYITG